MRNVNAICILILIISIVGISGCTTTMNNTTNTTEELNSSLIMAGNLTNSSGLIVVKSSDAWNGEVKIFNGSSQSDGSTTTLLNGRAERDDISGNGNKIYSLFGQIGGFSVTITKNSTSTSELTIELWINGEKVASNTTTSDSVSLKYGADVPML